jgi:hypothetical protein
MALVTMLYGLAHSEWRLGAQSSVGPTVGPCVGVVWGLSLAGAHVCASLGGYCPLEGSVGQPGGWAYVSALVAVEEVGASALVAGAHDVAALVAGAHGGYICVSLGGCMCQPWWLEPIGAICYPPISDSPFVAIVLDGLQRQLAKPKVRKEPVSGDMLSALVASLGDSPTLSDIRLVAACLLAFSAFLR